MANRLKLLLFVTAPCDIVGSSNKVLVVSVCDLKLNGEEGCNSFAGLIYPTAEHFELCRSRTPAVPAPSSISYPSRSRSCPLSEPHSPCDWVQLSKCSRMEVGWATINSRPACPQLGSPPMTGVEPDSWADFEQFKQKTVALQLGVGLCRVSLRIQAGVARVESIVQLSWLLQTPIRRLFKRSLRSCVASHPSKQR